MPTAVRILVLRCLSHIILAGVLAWPAVAQHHTVVHMTPASSDKFKLSAGPCAAKGYPMTIHLGDFVCSNGENFPVPSGHYLQGAWGASSRHWSIGDELHPVPATLRILYFSYAENKFYEGQFSLPMDKIHALLKQGFWDLDARQPVTYSEFTVCVLPKGAVVVWLTGLGKQVLVGRFQGAEAAADFHQFYPATDQAVMFQAQRAELLPAVQAQVVAGTISARQWDEYLKNYPWELAFSQPLKLTGYHAGFLNGEYTDSPTTADLKPYLQFLLHPTPKAVPQRWSVHVTDEAGHRHVLRVDPFDEAETQAAFRALHRAAPAAPITLLVETDKYLKKASLVLKNAAQQIPLTKSAVRIIAAD